jgi:hypothetical protein
VTDVTLSLISHTNVGKTTLARTLLRRDVGEVLDQAHVTEVSEAHPLIEADGHRLQLWDTPGFGDSARLLERMRAEQQPLGWFLHAVWDRVADRPLWCSQEAVRNVREDADVVLYLVNAAEAPEDAGYVAPELEILTLLDRPVLVLLNQTGEPGSRAELERAWGSALDRWPVVRGVLSLDAFTRSWIDEDRLLERIAPLLPAGPVRGAMDALARAWSERNVTVFRDAVAGMAHHLARAATDREAVARQASRAQKRRAMEQLATRLEHAEDALWDRVIAAHGLDGHLAVEARREVEHFLVQGQDPLDPKKGALLGGALGGAATGVVADLLSGGLSFGGGLVTGAVLGALGGAGLSGAARFARGQDEPAITWNAEFLDLLARQTVLRYLALAHFGRGRGEVREAELSATWRGAVDAAFNRDAAAWTPHWERGAEGRTQPEALEPGLGAALERTCRAVLGATA